MQQEGISRIGFFLFLKKKTTDGNHYCVKMAKVKEEGANLKG